ncbi:hypothetical protein AYI68_g7241, partial [Smittium mucronatum]
MVGGKVFRELLFDGG